MQIKASRNLKIPEILWKVKGPPGHYHRGSIRRILKRNFLGPFKKSPSVPSQVSWWQLTINCKGGWMRDDSMQVCHERWYQTQTNQCTIFFIKGNSFKFTIHLHSSLISQKKRKINDSCENFGWGLGFRRCLGLNRAGKTRPQHYLRVFFTQRQGENNEWYQGTAVKVLWKYWRSKWSGKQKHTVSLLQARKRLFK